ncbi:MAG: hypothetical protein ACTS6O_02385 [Giesbergeria sp.]
MDSIMRGLNSFAETDEGLILKFTQHPDFYAARLLDDCRQYARFLKKSGITASLSDGLEKVARAAGHPNWHALHSLAKTFHLVRPNGSRPPIDSLVSALPFMARTRVDCAPSDEEAANFSTVGRKLAYICGVSEIAILDMIGNMNGADSWAYLIARKPEDSTEALYQFKINSRGQGQFVESSACKLLIQRLDDLTGEGYQYLSEQESSEFDSYLSKVLNAKPDFLEGLLGKAESLRFQPEKRTLRGRLLTDAVRQANALIPADYNAGISWYDLPNRMYLRLLHAAMAWHADSIPYGATHESKAITLARRQLKLNPSDNLGVRYWLPILLSVNEKITAADKAIVALSETNNTIHSTHAHTAFVQAVCHFANKRYLDSAESLYIALFTFPPLRHIVRMDFRALEKSIGDKDDRRGVIPSMDAILDQYVCATSIDYLEAAFNAWLYLPEVEASEAELKGYYQDRSPPLDASLNRWEERVRSIAKALAPVALTAMENVSQN